MRKSLNVLTRRLLSFSTLFCLGGIFLLSSCKKDASPDSSATQLAPMGSAQAQSLQLSAAASSTLTYVRDGYTLNYTDNSGQLSTTTRDKMVNTFFTIYAQEANRFNTNTVKTVNLIIDPSYGGIAATSAGTTTFSYNYMNSHPNDIDVVTHESMHIVQAYGNTNAPGWLIEGIADYARYTYGIYNAAQGWALPAYSSGQSYTNSYGVTARFLVWLEQHYAANLVDQLNTVARNHTYTSNTWVSITGKTVDQLYSEYGQNPGLSTGNTGIASGSTYKIVSATNNSSVLDVKSSGTANGTLVDLYSANGSNAQKWKVTSVGSEYYKLQPANAPSAALNVHQSGTTDGTQVDIWADNGTAAQKWQINSVGNGYYTLTPANATGSRLDISGGATANGTKVQIWTSNSSNSQKFQFIKQ